MSRESVFGVIIRSEKGRNYVIITAIIIYKILKREEIQTNSGEKITNWHLKIKGEWLMRLGKYLSSLTKPELEELKEQLNLSDNELVVFDNLSKDRSKVTIADNCLVSVSTIDNRIKTINSKLNRLKGGDSFGIKR